MQQESLLVCDIDVEKATLAMFEFDKAQRDNLIQQLSRAASSRRKQGQS